MAATPKSVYQRRKLVLYCHSLDERAAIQKAAEAWAEARGLSKKLAVSGFCRFAVLLAAGLPLDAKAALRRAKEAARKRRYLKRRQEGQ